MEINKIIRMNVMNLRSQKGWSQDELAIQMDKTRTWVTHIESGRTKVIKPEHLEQLAKVFSVTPSYLISNENSKGETEMLKVVVEEGMEESYWVIVVDEADEKKGYYMGDDIDRVIKDKKKTFREIALKNGAEMDWNCQLGQYEFIFEGEEGEKAAIKTKKELEKLI